MCQPCNQCTHTHNANSLKNDRFISIVTAPSVPMRGGGRGMRGMGRGRGNPRMNDMFRSRKQNTSRPPSMHVDDFMAMESAKSHDSSPMRRPGPKVCSKIHTPETVRRLVRVEGCGIVWVGVFRHFLGVTTTTTLLYPYRVLQMKLHETYKKNRKKGYWLPKIT